MIKKLLKVLSIGLGGFILLIIILAILFPVKTELSITSYKNNDEVVDQNFEVKGTYKGIPDKILVNGAEAEKKSSDSTFRKIITLKPGENRVIVEAIKGGKTEYTTESVVYYNLEAQLYLEKEKASSQIPSYELVRKENLNNGFSAIVYADIVSGDKIDEVSLANIARDIKSKNQSINEISLLIFSSGDKNEVEAILEKEGNEEGFKQVGSKVKADYEKTVESEDLFMYPSGLTGEKVTLEV